MNWRGVVRFLFVVAIGISIISPQAMAEYPRKPVALMVSYAAGGSTDIGARIIAAIAEKKLGKSIIVLNKGGAGGQVGWTELSRRKPDGYTIGFLNLPAVNTVILDPERKAVFGKDAFTFIINQVLDPGAVIVSAASPYKTIEDLIADAKKRPGKITAGTTGILSDDHLAILMLEKAAGVKFRIVHFQGGAPLRTAVMGGKIDVAFNNVGGDAPRVKAGELRMLLILDKERSRFVPDVPTSVEKGYPTAISSSTRGIAGPKGMPADIVKKLQDVLKEAMNDPDHMDKMNKAGLAVKIMVGKEYEDYFNAYHETAKELMKIAR